MLGHRYGSQLTLPHVFEFMKHIAHFALFVVGYVVQLDVVDGHALSHCRRLGNPGRKPGQWRRLQEEPVLGQRDQVSDLEVGEGLH